MICLLLKPGREGVAGQGVQRYICLIDLASIRFVLIHLMATFTMWNALDREAIRRKNLFLGFFFKGSGGGS